MCGIAGFIDFSDTLSKGDLKSMTEVLHHRGPNGAGYELHESANYKVGLGHRRLSIIDLSDKGSQPMHKHGVVISFNGEIYNFLDVRKQLIKLDYSFDTESDTEVILSAYDAWGIDCVHHFKGMFSIALYDYQQSKLYLIRDRAGVKPLYVYRDGDVILFASELKSFHEVSLFKKEIDLNALASYMMYGNVPVPMCIFKNAFKLRQGQYLEIDLHSKQMKETPYWRASDYIQSSGGHGSIDDILNRTESILTSAFNYRMVSDVPVGVFLSGGYDSTLVTALLQRSSSFPLRTFTIGFEDQKYNEAPNARLVSDHLGTNHTEQYCTTDEAKSIIPMLSEIYDEPFGDQSAIPTYMVSKIASEHVKVVLSADGGDEQFVGYTRYLKGIRLARMMQKTPSILNNLVGGILEKSNDQVWQRAGSALRDGMITNIPYHQSYSISYGLIGKLFKRDVLPYRSCKDDIPDDINGMFVTEYEEYMQNMILTKVDRATMANSIEGREPFLDEEIIKWVLSLPVSIKYQNNTLKYLLKTICHKYVPRAIMERPKMGFGIPVMDWISGDLNYLISEYLDLERIRKQEIFDVRAVSNYLEQFRLTNTFPYNTVIWYLLIFQMWYDRWVD